MKESDARIVKRKGNRQLEGWEENDETGMRRGMGRCKQKNAAASRPPTPETTVSAYETMLCSDSGSH